MKRYTILVLVFGFVTAFTSCSLENDSNYVGNEIIPIESVEIPDHFLFGESYEIEITYNRPSTCYRFYNFLYEINENERTVAIINSVYNNSTCVQEEESVTVTLNFLVTETETYLFKFYQGRDEEGEDQYYLAEVPVLDERPTSDAILLD
ncbi:hypothetical protein ITJ86_03560 [Winogradskyella sp. F6397]|uniref:DUF3872 domain-containing protein n=1 Tax=Winogradskyella marina TaxID=2785530 RepID=A0ABS0EES2_9FLAO|nr:hypothetical protein [Winogradskyella marina]MBF8148957.1 hypothetical protein [Winogradskyella marina]